MFNITIKKFKFIALFFTCIICASTFLRADMEKIRILVNSLKKNKKSSFEKKIPDRKSIVKKKLTEKILVKKKYSAPAKPIFQTAFIENEKAIELAFLLSLVKKGNPELSLFNMDLAKNKLETIMASRSPNPEFEIEIENIGGSGESGAFDSAEVKLVLGQEIERGGKRLYRIREAELLEKLTRFQQQLRLREIEGLAIEKFVEAFFSQESFVMNEKLLAWAQKVRQVVLEKVDSGKVSALELSKTDVEISKIRINMASKKRDLQNLRLELAELFGKAKFPEAKLVANTSIRQGLPEYDLLKKSITKHPSWFLSKMEIEYYKTLQRKNRSESVPNITLAGGMTYDRGSEDKTWMVAVSMPLQINDNKQDAVKIARINKEKSLLKAEAKLLDLNNRLSVGFLNLKTAYEKLSIFQNEVLPAAKTSFEGARLGYERGKLGLLEVLDAQRSLAEVQELHIDTLCKYFIDLAKIRELTGIPRNIFSLNTRKNKKEKTHE